MGLGGAKPLSEGDSVRATWTAGPIASKRPGMGMASLTCLAGREREG